MDRQSDQVRPIESVGRVAARGLVIAGGAFWMIAAFAGPYVYEDMSLADSLGTAIWPFLAVVVILITGWTYERLASVLLFGASVAVLVWGLMYQWEPGVWVLMMLVLLAPMMSAGILFLLASDSEYRRSRAAARRLAAEGRTVELPLDGMRVRPQQQGRGAA